MRARNLYREALQQTQRAARTQSQTQDLREQVRKAYADGDDAAGDAIYELLTEQTGYLEDGLQEGEGTGEQYSLCQFEDGRRFVEIDQDQDRFEGHDRSEYPAIAKTIINEKFNGKVIGLDNRAFVNGNGRDEYIHPSKWVRESSLYDAKMCAAGELDNLLDAGERVAPQPDGRDGHIHEGVRQWEYYDTMFKIGNRYFRGVVNVAKIDRGLLFKDITKIEDVSQDIMDSYGGNPKFQFLRTSSMDSIYEMPPKVNPTHEQFSFSSAKAKTADLKALETAKQMQEAGVADETIRQQTGWFMGMDGKWRWEISDEGGENARTNIDTQNEQFSFAPTESKQKGTTFVTATETRDIQNIGRKSVNQFTPEEVQTTETFAKKYWEEMGVKSPFFRAWFGDWRAHDQTQIEIVDASVSKVYAAGKATNADTGRVISWGSDFIRETTKHQRSGGVSSDIVGHIPEIVEKAILLDSVTSELSSKTKMPGTVFMHSFYALVDSGDSTALVKLYAEEAVSLKSGEPFTRAYQLKDIAIVATSANGVHPTNGSLTDANIATIYTVADMFTAVKRRDGDFSPNPVNPVLLNADGTPKKFYHGTDQRFTVFKPEEMSSVEGSFFFAENREDAAAYGGNIYEVYLRGRNFADYDNQPREFYQLKNKRAQVEWLKARGYDGWYADIDSDGWGEVSVFKNTQVKSATDNIGTFDSSNPDIQYSFTPAEGQQQDQEPEVLTLADEAAKRREQMYGKQLRDDGPRK